MNSERANNEVNMKSKTPNLDALMAIAYRRQCGYTSAAVKSGATLVVPHETAQRFVARKHPGVRTVLASMVLEERPVTGPMLPDNAFLHAANKEVKDMKEEHGREMDRRELWKDEKLIGIAKSTANVIVAVTDLKVKDEQTVEEIVMKAIVLGIQSVGEPVKSEAPVQDFGKEAPFQRSDKDDLSNPYGQHMGPSQLDRIERKVERLQQGFEGMLEQVRLLGAPAPTGVGRSTPAAGCAEPTATPSRNPPALPMPVPGDKMLYCGPGNLDLGIGTVRRIDYMSGWVEMGWEKSEPSTEPLGNLRPYTAPGLAKEYRDGGGTELDVYLFKKSLDELGDRLMELWTGQRPKFTENGPPIPEGSISYKMRFVDADGKHIKGEPRVFLDPEQPTPAWTPKEGDMVFYCGCIDGVPKSAGVVTNHPEREWDKRFITADFGEGPGVYLSSDLRPATELEVQQWEAEQEAKKPLAPGVVVRHKNSKEGYYLTSHKGTNAHFLALKDGTGDFEVMFCGRGEFKVLEP